MAEVDLSLLRALDALLDTSSVTEAAVRLHLSAPATSRALGRLRVGLGDPLLVRAGRSLVMTPFAQQLAPRVKALLQDVDTLVQTPDSDPRTWQRTFSVRMNDGLAPILAPRLLHLVASEAPGVRIRFLDQDSKEPDMLRDGSLDLDIGIRVASPPDVLSSPLFVDHFVAVVRADSRLGRQEVLRVEDLAEHPHISASRRGLARGPVDDQLEARGLHRRVVAIAPSHALGALMVLEDDVICLLPHRMTSHLITRGLPLREHSVPLPLPPVPVEQRWHARTDRDHGSRWLRGLLQLVAADVADDPKT